MPQPRQADTDDSAIVILRRAGFQQYEAAATEFRSRIRAPVRLLTVDLQNGDATLKALREGRPRLVLALGQSAYDLARGSGIRPLIHAFVFSRARPKDPGVQMFVPPRQTLETLTTILPTARSVAILSGPSTAWLAQIATQAARDRGLVAVQLQATSAQDTLRILREGLSQADALWLLPDSDLLTPQVVQYAIALQLRRRIALVGATRRHVERGALLALDYAPHEIGRDAARMAHRLLAGRSPRRTRFRRRNDQSAAQYGSGTPRASVNQGSAEALGLTVALLPRHTEIVQ